MDDDEMMMTALDAGADDFSVDGNVYEVLLRPKTSTPFATRWKQRGTLSSEAKSTESPI